MKVKWQKHVLFRENGDNLEEDKLEEVAREGEDDTEDDLYQHSLLFILLVKPPVEKPQPSPAEQRYRTHRYYAFEDRPSPCHPAYRKNDKKKAVFPDSIPSFLQADGVSLICTPPYSFYIYRF